MIAAATSTLACALVLATAAQAAVTQPPQPEAGPGGSDYAHAGMRVSSGGAGSDAWYVFQPKDGRGRSGRRWRS